MISPLLAQRLIAAPFLVLGAWCLMFPAQVEQLTIRADHVSGSVTTALFIGCFGAQAILSGLFAAFSCFTKTTFLVYGIALLPFFWFNYWFVFVIPIFNGWMALDFVSNAMMLLLCIAGYRASTIAHSDDIEREGRTDAARLVSVAQLGRGPNA